MKMNNCILIGRLVKDVDMRKTSSGKDVCTFTIAINDTKDTTDFANCEAWGNVANTIAQYCHKGDELGIVGKFRNRKESDDKYHPRFVVQSFEFGAKKKAEESDALETIDDIAAKAAQYPALNTDELPF